MTNAELEVKVKGLEKALEEMMGAVRNLSRESNQNATSVVSAMQEVNKLKGELAQLKVQVKTGERVNKASVNRYE